MEIVEFPIEKLKLLRNPKIHPEEQVLDVMESLKKYAFVEAAVVAKHDNTLLGGYCRLEATKRLGLKTMECRFVDLKPEEYLPWIFTEYRTGEKGSLDYEIAIEWFMDDANKALRDNVVGWDPEQIDDMIRMHEEQAQSVDLAAMDRGDEVAPLAPSKVDVVISVPLSIWEKEQSEIQGVFADLCLRFKGIKQSQPKVKH